MAEYERDFEITFDSPPVYRIKLSEAGSKIPVAEEWINVFEAIDYGNGDVMEGIDLALERLKAENEYDERINNINNSLVSSPPPKYQLGIILYPENATKIIH